MIKTTNNNLDLKQKNIKIKKILIIFFSLLIILTIFAFVRTNTLRFLIIALSAFPSYIFSSYCINYLIDHMNNNYAKKRQIFLKLFVCFIFSVYIYLSFFHKFVGSGKISAISNFGVLIIMSLTILIFTDFLSHIKVSSAVKSHKPIPKRKKMLIFFTFSLFPFFTGLLIFLGYFPGSMNIDFFVVYSYILNSSYTDAHPVMYSMLLKILSFIYSDLPVTLSIFHILLSSFTYTYIAYRLNEMGLSLFFSFFLILILTLIPANFFINSMLWKDVIYTMFLLLFSIEILRMFTNDKYFHKTFNIILFIVFGFFVLIARHNGQYVLVLLALITGLYFSFKKQIKTAFLSFIMICLVICVFFITKTITIHSLGEKYIYHPYTSNVLYSTAAQGMLVLYIDNFEQLDDHQREGIEFFIDINKAKLRNKKIDEQGWAFDMWKFKNDGAPFLLLENVKGNKSSFCNLYLSLCHDFPNDIFDAYMKTTALAWSSLNYEYTYPMDLNINEPFGGSEIKIEQNIMLKKVNLFMEKLANTLTSNDFTIMIFFRPAFMLILIVFVLLISNRNKNAIFLSLPVLLNHFGYFFGCSAQDTRYLYGNYSIFFVLLFYVILNISLSATTTSIKNECGNKDIIKTGNK